jgi:hypothetical protein
VQPVGFPSSGTTRNSMGAPGAATDADDACGVDACCVEHPAMRALAIASATNVPVKLRICCLPFHWALTQFENSRAWNRGSFGYFILSRASRKAFVIANESAASLVPANDEHPIDAGGRHRTDD